MTRGGHTYGAEVENTVAAESYVYTLMTVTAPGAVVRACFQPAAKTGAAQGRNECFEGRVH
ncbi:hypothetical protein [Streptomyces sp. Agncl-13]|uniref:hypothetical protein n=1 Tax=Streptomyces sp. Agncl-13 TaxID=3400628 RepID=UPI003A86DE18